MLVKLIRDRDRTSSVIPQRFPAGDTNNEPSRGSPASLGRWQALQVRMRL
jgi:hypothetical protein